MLKSTKGTAGAESNTQNTPTTAAILMVTAAVLVGFMMIYLAWADGSVPL